MRKLITAPARKNKRTARMLANARKCSQRPLDTPGIGTLTNKMQNDVYHRPHQLIRKFIAFITVVNQESLSFF